MVEQTPEIYGLEFQSRALATRVGETEKIQFLCGTLTIRNENQVHLVDYDEETGVLNKMMFPYPAGEIWDISCSYTDKDIIVINHGGIEEGQYVRHSNLLRMKGGDPDETDLGFLEPLGTFDTPNAIQRSIWHPGGSHSQVATMDDKSSLCLWTIEGGAKPQEMNKIQLDSKGRVCHTAVCWSSHHNYTQLLVSADSTLYSWDTRTNISKQLLDHHHGPCVRDIDCNPNRPYYFVSCGDDCAIQFWDWRKLDHPLLTRQDHSHWVWSVQYNLFHDQLILSGSSDSQVLLTRVASIASEPLRHMEDEDGPAPQPQTDEVISRYEEHEDSVYAVKWSSSDAWVFASLSYDGRLVINHVPSNEKFCILTS